MKKLLIISSIVLAIAMLIGLFHTKQNHTKVTAGILHREAIYNQAVQDLEKMTTASSKDIETKTNGLTKLTEAKDTLNAKDQKNWVLQTILFMLALPITLGIITYYLGYRSMNQAKRSLA